MRLARDNHHVEVLARHDQRAVVRPIERSDELEQMAIEAVTTGRPPLFSGALVRLRRET
jgi:hypothetical protein